VTKPSHATPRAAYLCLDGWAGRSEQAVMVVGETPKRYRIRAVMDGTRMQGNWRQLKAGQEALVPKRAIRFS
jgi:hypothetical protein